MNCISQTLFKKILDKKSTKYVVCKTIPINVEYLSIVLLPVLRDIRRDFLRDQFPAVAVPMVVIDEVGRLV